MAEQTGGGKGESVMIQAKDRHNRTPLWGKVYRVKRKMFL